MYVVSACPPLETTFALYGVSAFRRTSRSPAQAGHYVLRGNRKRSLKPDVTLRTETYETYAPLALLSASHHGVDVTLNDLAPLGRWLRETVAAPNVRAVRHPMRSLWWMLPFLGCQTVDWWITSSRRRRR